jgi:hypothetical protein
MSVLAEWNLGTSNLQASHIPVQVDVTLFPKFNWRKTVKKLGLSLIAFALLCMMSSVPAASAQGGGQAAAPPTKMGAGQKVHHPEIRQAMIKLNEAKTHLHEGARDFQGHKKKAIEFINQAERELQEALQSDKNEN